MPETYANAVTALRHPNDTKIVMLVLDGLGGLPVETGGPTELESARTPHLDDLAARGMTGLHLPVGPGITPGSGPGHLGIFGYDPLTYRIGRGALAAAGIGFDLQAGDVTARGNFCTVDKDGQVTDRRAGRIDTDTNRRLCEKLEQITLEGVEIFVRPIKQHRFLLVLRGEGLSPEINDTDSQQTGVPPREPAAKASGADATAAHLRNFVHQAGERLREESKANMVLLRGFADKPEWPSFEDRFGLRGIALAAYPMYKGLARLLGMETLPQADTVNEHIGQLRNRWADFDFFFLHVKDPDSYGEDGDFQGKVKAIEAVDDTLPALLKLKPDVLIVTGDHSTPAALKSHSWHPVPVVLSSPTCRPDTVTQFGERACMAGAMGARFPAIGLLPLALAHAQRLEKYGA